MVKMTRHALMTRGVLRRLARSQAATSWVVGINAEPGTAEWRARVYYPGVRSKDEAIVIELGTAERRSGVDFKIPRLAGVK